MTRTLISMGPPIRVNAPLWLWGHTLQRKKGSAVHDRLISYREANTLVSVRSTRAFDGRALGRAMAERFQHGAAWAQSRKLENVTSGSGESSIKQILQQTKRIYGHRTVYKRTDVHAFGQWVW